ncbi:MAG: hypothetical protein EOM05_11870 [Clostridia bacterium]|nr:hypothetical protein [Clostridia bacterium]
MKKNEIKYTIFNLATEYPYLVGETSWAIISDASEKELLEDFEELKQYKPFILFTKESWALLSDVFHESKLNDNKHRMRGVRRHDLFGYIDGETELYTKETHEDVVVSEVVQKSQAEQVSKALDKLTPTQKRRINLYYFSELTLLEISNIESTSIKQVHKSIRLAKDKLKKLLKQG